MWSGEREGASRIPCTRQYGRTRAVRWGTGDPVVARFVAGAPKKTFLFPGRLLNISRAYATVHGVGLPWRGREKAPDFQSRR